MKNFKHPARRAQRLLQAACCMLHSLPQNVLLALTRLYRWLVSPVLVGMFGPRGGCRFTPTCSAYALEAVQQHGATAGSWLAVKRLCRCHPWGGCGPDPVPPATLNAQLSTFNSLPHGS